MTPAVVLAIIVATQNVDDQATEAMRSTAAEAVGGDESVVIREMEGLSDGEALRIEQLVHAQAVAQVTWLDPEHTRARVRVHVVETARWSERTITFAVVDTSVERGRALGFAVTSMLPEETLVARPHAGGPRGGAGGGPAEELGSALRVVGVGSGSVGSGIAGGMGFGLAGEFALNDTLAARIGGSWRQGPVKILDGTATAFSVAVGVAFWPRRPSPERRIAVGVRVDALGIYHRVTDQKPDALNNLQTQWIPAIDAMGEVGLSVTRMIDIVASGGVEATIFKLALTETPMPTVEDPMPVTRESAHVPQLRLVGEAGIRVSF